jgi:hypothetical protein
MLITSAHKQYLTQVVSNIRLLECICANFIAATAMAKLTKHLLMLVAGCKYDSFTGYAMAASI